ncbi:hypothetical protein OIU83_15625 [Flavobacterium sp. LS1R49]|uniref:Uncharacterized protein n=1 Tax=Flavobacterium shii TaxID=2987687 RepID=A0A9X3BYN5_9FLAO|nr:hypothetical protein [Flavobacterium shii]MCV9929095.1 hypothetical protein [Flavobacterium shii]
MKNNTRLLLFLAIIGIVAGTIIKLQGYKTIGDTFLGLSTLVWLYIIGSFIYARQKR